MMITLFKSLACLFLGGASLLSSGSWPIVETGIYKPLLPFEVDVADDGQVFMLNQRSCQVLHYGSDGGLIKTIGGKGQGPGEMEHAWYMTLFNDELVVQEYFSANFFDKKGVFQKKIRFPDMQLMYFRVQNGWVSYPNAIRAGGRPFECIWWSTDFSESKTLLTWEMGSLEDKYYLGTLNDRSQVVVDPFGRRIYVRQTGRFKIHIIDALTAKVEGIVERDTPRVLVPTDWLEKTNARRRSKNLTVISRSEVPEYYPTVSEMRCYADGTLSVRAHGHNENKYEVYDYRANGEAIAAKGFWFGRIFALRGGVAYVSVFDDDVEEAGLHKMPLAEVEEFAANHPINAYPIPQ